MVRRQAALAAATLLAAAGAASAAMPVAGDQALALRLADTALGSAVAGTTWPRPAKPYSCQPSLTGIRQTAAASKVLAYGQRRGAEIGEVRVAARVYASERDLRTWLARAQGAATKACIFHANASAFAARKCAGGMGPIVRTRATVSGFAVRQSVYELRWSCAANSGSLFVFGAGFYRGRVAVSVTVAGPEGTTANRAALVAAVGAALDRSLS